MPWRWVGHCDVYGASAHAYDFSVITNDKIIYLKHICSADIEVTAGKRRNAINRFFYRTRLSKPIFDFIFEY